MHFLCVENYLHCGIYTFEVRFHIQTLFCVNEEFNQSIYLLFIPLNCITIKSNQITIENVLVINMKEQRKKQ